MVSRPTFERHVPRGERATRISCPDCAGVLGTRRRGSWTLDVRLSRRSHVFDERPSRRQGTADRGTVVERRRRPRRARRDPGRLRATSSASGTRRRSEIPPGAGIAVRGTGGGPAVRHRQQPRGGSGRRSEPYPHDGGRLVINTERIRRNIITIGASAGGVEALGFLFSLLPRDVPAAIAMVLHRSPVSEGRLARVLSRRTLVRTRPAVDPLFRSAAEVYGERVVGVLLSGYGDDGVSGLIDIKKAGGLSLVQNPEEALQASMPCTAIRDDDVDAVLTLHALAAAIVDLVKGEVVDVKPPDRAVSQCDQRRRIARKVILD